MANKLNINGFDLIIGPMYNNGWMNESEPHHSSSQHCPKCNERTTIHWLKKYIFAFGNTIIHHATISACPNCLHEVLLDKTERKRALKLKAKKPKVKSITLGKFQLLPIEEQERILKLAGLEVN